MNLFVVFTDQQFADLSPKNFISSFRFSLTEAYLDLEQAEKKAKQTKLPSIIYEVELDEQHLQKMESGICYCSTDLIQNIISVRPFYPKLQQLDYDVWSTDFVALDEAFNRDNKQELMSISSSFESCIEDNKASELLDLINRFQFNQNEENHDDLQALYKFYRVYIQETEQLPKYMVTERDFNYRAKMNLLAEVAKIRLFLQSHTGLQADLHQKLHKFLNFIAKLDTEAGLQAKSYASLAQKLTEASQLIVRAFGLNAQGLPNMSEAISASEYRSDVKRLLWKNDYAKELEMLGFILLALAVCIPAFALVSSGSISPLCVAATAAVSIGSYGMFAASKKDSMSLLIDKLNAINSREAVHV